MERGKSMLDVLEAHAQAVLNAEQPADPAKLFYVGLQLGIDVALADRGVAQDLMQRLETLRAASGGRAAESARSDLPHTAEALTEALRDARDDEVRRQTRH